jgi:hypothetical protein
MSIIKQNIIDVISTTKLAVYVPIILKFSIIPDNVTYATIY